MESSEAEIAVVAEQFAHAGCFVVVNAKIAVPMCRHTRLIRREAADSAPPILRRQLLQEKPGSVGGTVVYGNEFKIREGLRQNGRHRSLHIACGIVDRKNHGDGGCSATHVITFCRKRQGAATIP